MVNSVRAAALLLLVCVATVIAGGQEAKAQTVNVELYTSATETTGSGSGFVFNSYWHDCRNEILYLGSELTAAGIIPYSIINSVSFKVAQLPGKNLENVRIRIKHSSQSSLAAPFSNSTGFQLCYGPTTLTPGVFTVGQWYTFTFHTPFTWDGTSNLVIDYTIDGNSWVSGGGSYLRNLSGTRTLYGYSDSGYTYPFDSMPAYTRTSVPSTRLNYTPGGLTIITPSPLPSGAEQTFYSQTIQAGYGVTPYFWNTSVTGLPPGLSVSQVGDNLQLSGTPTTAGVYNFTLSLTDSDSPPDNDSKAFQLTIVPPPAPIPFLDDFSTFTGWQLGTTWQRGAAAGYSASSPTRSEPSTDATPGSTDNMILGDNIGGDYGNLGATTWAISPMVNCSTAATVRLRFQRWLGLNLEARAFIEVSNNGSTWTTIWSHNNGSTQSSINTPTSWQGFAYDLTPHAAGYATVQVRFGIGPTNSSYPNVGWCIDDFEIFEPGPDLEVKEGGLTGTAIVHNQAVGGLRNFGQVTMGQQSTPLTISLTNNSFSNISFGTPFTKAGTNPGDFYYDASAGAGFLNPLPVGQSCTFTITFYVAAAGTPGVKTANISFTHNAGGVANQTFTINLQAEAVAPGTGVIEVYVGSTAGPQVSHQQPAAGTARDFGSIAIGTGPTAAITLVVHNPGPGTLSITQPDMAGTYWPEYIVGTVSATSIPQGSSATFTVAFDPQTWTGTLDAFVRIPNTQQGGPAVFEVPVVGISLTTAPSLDIREGSATGPTIPHDTAPTGPGRDFGDQGVSAGPTAPLTIYIGNPGGQNLTLGNPALGGPDAAHFQLNLGGYSTSLAPSASTSFAVVFDPSSAGQKDAQITITHNDTSKTNPYIIRITGNGVLTNPVIEVRESNGSGPVMGNPGSFAFGNVVIGASASRTVYVENAGTAPMTLGTPALSGTAANQYSVAAGGFAGQLAVGASVTFMVTFTPTSTGNKTAAVSFTHNGAGTTSPFVINLTGNGINNVPVMEVTEDVAGGTVITNGAGANGTGRDLGSQDVSSGAGTAKVIVIANTGAQNLVVGTPTLAGTDAAHFVLNTVGFNGTVTPGNSTQFSVSFDPINVGVKDAQVEFTHNDASTATPFILRFKGTGTDPNGVIITTSSLPPTQAGTAYPTTVMQAAQGTGPYVWSTYNSSMPAGLTLDPDGTISGVAANSGRANVTIRVTDATGGTNDRAFSIEIGGSLLGNAKKGGGGGGCESGHKAPWLPIGLGLLALLALRPRRRSA